MNKPIGMSVVWNFDFGLLEFIWDFRFGAWNLCGWHPNRNHLVKPVRPAPAISGIQYLHTQYSAKGDTCPF